jgi:hypothetical protein
MCFSGHESSIEKRGMYNTAIPVMVTRAILSGRSSIFWPTASLYSVDMLSER